MIPAKIARIIPRLASNHVGELVAARDAISRGLAALGLDWHDLAAAVEKSTQPTSGAARRPLAFGDLARAVRDLDRGRLSPRERKFANDMCALGWGFAPTSRQVDWMVALFGRLSKERAAA